MSARTCWHPNCYEEMPRGRYCCMRHWNALTGELRAAALQAMRDNDDERIERVQEDVEEYFAERMIGDLEITRCRHRECSADIVFLLSKAGKPVPVNADTVNAGDDQFKYGKHIAHFTTCPVATDFRK